LEKRAVYHVHPPSRRTFRTFPQTLKNLFCPSAHFIQQLDEIALGFEAAAQLRQISRKLALSLRAAQIVAAILAMIPPEGFVGF